MPTQHQPPWQVQPILAGFVGKRLPPLVQPVLEHLQPADIILGLGEGIQLERAALADDGPFFLLDQVKASFVQPTTQASDDGFPKYPLGLGR